MVITNVFPKLETVNNFLRTLSQKGRFRTRIDSQHVKASQILATRNSNATIWKIKKNLYFLFHFWNLHQILNILKKSVIAIANVFLKSQTLKNVVRPLSKKRSFRTCLDSQHEKVSQILAKSQWERFCHVFSSFKGKLIWKIAPLLLGEILEVFVNTLIADNEYPVHDCENLPLPMQMQWCEKQKYFSQFFVLFPESICNFKHFEKKGDRHS